MLRRLPAFLIALRGLLGPLLFALALGGRVPWLFAAGLGLALLSDIFDGVLARRLGVASPRLRWADSVVDGWFVLWVAAALLLTHFETLRPGFPLLAAYLLTDVAGWLADLGKYGRVAAYHAYSSKLTGVLLFAATVPLSLRDDPALLWVALGVGVLNHLERLAMTLVLPHWTPDVPTLWHALRRRAAGG
ncbi:hypothetical protein DEIPH_ctg004orf0119 [Deinococcus phoenicis]|uniref:CDP-alcohol phosphatidyltransferase n=1 Tax=Deinococcus phoenicis TaxID=1476583 RepID=A0A016QU66_9DEIO|nr:CDP-alcohol phosphatidyltransferase family protein [Deinococcus phoenicis]EYB69598.1 hypothetical protein DEIPH_ctg004orf0119 [Deinococcus phoenicis]